MRDLTHHSIFTDGDRMKARGRSDSEKAGDLFLCQEVIDLVWERQISEAVDIVSQKDIIILDELSDPQQTLTDVGVLTRIDKSDSPVLDVFAQQLNLLSTVGENEVIRDALVVV